MSRVYIADVFLNGQPTGTGPYPFFLVSRRLDALQNQLDQEFKDDAPLTDWVSFTKNNHLIWMRQYQTSRSVGVWTIYIAENNLI